MSDLLLYALTTFGALDISRFNIIFGEVVDAVANDFLDNFSFSQARMQTLRFLDALGHCDYDYDTYTLCICPPTLVLLPSYGLPKAVLTGARSPSLLMTIKSFIRDHSQSIEYSAVQQAARMLPLPFSIFIQASSKDLMRELASSARLAFDSDPACWKLLLFSAGIDSVRASLTFMQRAEIGWGRRYFSSRLLRFERTTENLNEIRLIEYTDPVTQQKRHLLWSGDSSADVDRDWGRFLILNERKRDILLYDERRFSLAIPKTVPLPRILARALVLCSGTVPVEVNLINHHIKTLPSQCMLHVYDGVAGVIAKRIAERVGQNLTAVDLEIDENGVVV
jgi:hypothetical protein